ncbi:MAG: hypothetical protein CBD18_02760 [Opitutales bacterium TMED158]|nr:MAG: hypothetical protein CBD18_02760 [Opitutales bacterium TMED158]
MSDTRAPDGTADVWQFVMPQLSVHNGCEAQASCHGGLDFKIAWIDNEDFGSVYNGTAEIYFSPVGGPVVPPNERGDGE